MFAETLSNFSDNTAVVLESQNAISYLQLQKYVDLFSQKLNQTSSRKLIFLPCYNSLASLVAYLACLRSKHPVLLLDPALSDDWKQQLIERYRPNYIVEAVGETPGLVHLSSVTLNIHPDLALLLSTSGSTGSPKQVKISYKNIQSNANSIVQYLQLSADERAITSLPMHYSYGLSVINSHLTAGGAIVLSEASVVSKDFWRSIKSNSVTSIVGVPYTYEILYRLRFHNMELPSLRYMTQAGGKLDKKYIKYFANHLQNENKRFYVMYGQTEATARMSYVPPENIVDVPESIGVAIPDGHFTLEHDDGTLITKPHEIGELVYRGPNVMMGYALSDADLEADSVSSELKTGDLAKFDDQGYFFVTGRKNRFIKLSGNRIDLGEIEAKLLDQGWVGYCVGNDQGLYVITDNLLWKELIKRYLCDSLRLHHSIVAVHVMKDIPRLANGKINYGALLMVMVGN